MLFTGSILKQLPLSQSVIMWWAALWALLTQSCIYTLHKEGHEYNTIEELSRTEWHCPGFSGSSPAVKATHFCKSAAYVGLSSDRDLTITERSVLWPLYTVTKDCPNEKEAEKPQPVLEFCVTKRTTQFSLWFLSSQCRRNGLKKSQSICHCSLYW